MKAPNGTATRLRDERGISAVIAVVSIIAIFSGAVLSLDFGSAWVSRRTIITATDATALQQAQVAALAANPSSCTNFMDYLTRNANDLVPNTPKCDLNADPAFPGTGYVKVEAQKYAIAPFGGLFGIGRTQPFSLSAAEYGFVPKPEGLRPMSFCLDNAHVLQWIWYQNWLRVQQGQAADPNFGQLSDASYNQLKGTFDAGRPPVKGTNYHSPYQTGDSVLFVPPPGATGLEPRIDYPLGSADNGVAGTSYSSYGVVHRMFFTKDSVYEGGNCGGSTGNWGWIALDGGQPSTQRQNDWTLNGYDGQVGANDCNADGTTGDACPGDTGSSGGAGAQELQSLIDSEAQFYIPIFSSVCCGTGSNAEFTIWGFLPLVLRGFKTTGQEATRYFDFEFKDSISSGPCCEKTGGLGGAKGVRICAVDHDGDTTPAIIAARCGQ